MCKSQCSFLVIVLVLSCFCFRFCFALLLFIDICIPHVSCNHFFHFCPFKAFENTTPTSENFGSFFGIVVKYRNKRLSPSGSDHSKRLVLIGDWRLVNGLVSGDFVLKLLSFVFVLCFVLISYFLFLFSWFLSFPSVLCRFLSFCLPFSCCLHFYFFLFDKCSINSFLFILNSFLVHS